MNIIYEQLSKKLEKVNAYGSALVLLEWDMETLAPELATENTAKVVGILSEDYQCALVHPEVKTLLEQVETTEQWGTLSEMEQATIRELRRMYEQLEPIPTKEYAAYNELVLKSSAVWTKAREEDHFASFAS